MIAFHFKAHVVFYYMTSQLCDETVSDTAVVFKNEWHKSY